MRSMRTLAAVALAAAATLSGTAANGAGTIAAGPTQAATVTFTGEQLYVKVEAVATETVSDTGTTRTMEGCAEVGRTDGQQIQRLCGPLTLQFDPTLSSARITGTLESVDTGTDITLDFTITGQGDITPAPTYAVSSSSVDFGAVLTRGGDVVGSINSQFGTTQAAGSSWYGQLVQEAGGSANLP